MEIHKPNIELPPIPSKRYFTIGEVSELCGVKAHVLRYWEQEFNQLNPVKRSGNRRYYQHHELILIRQIRELLYEQGFTISGARNRLGNARVLNTPAELLDRVAVPSSPPVISQCQLENPGIDLVMLKREISDIIAILSA